MKKIIILLMALSFISCNEDDSMDETVQKMPKTVTTISVVQRLGTTYVTQPIYAGQNILAGYLEISNDGTHFEVEYFATGDWKFTELHLYVGDLAFAPQAGNGNPIPGRFNYKVNFTNATAVTSYSFVVPLNAINGIQDQCIIVAAHSVMKRFNETGAVVQTETGWGGLVPFAGANWATYSNYCLSNGTPIDPEK